MKSLSEIVADNAEIDQRIRAKETAKLRRLKKRVARGLGWDAPTRRKVFAAIDAWAKAERKRNG